MPSGFLGKSSPSANTWTNIYTVPSGKVSSISINVVNRNINPTNIDIVLSTSSTSGGISLSEYLEFLSLVDGNGGQLERTGIVIDDVNAKYVWIRTGNSDTSFQVYGYEE